MEQIRVSFNGVASNIGVELSEVAEVSHGDDFLTTVNVPIVRNRMRRTAFDQLEKIQEIQEIKGPWPACMEYRITVTLGDDPTRVGQELERVMKEISKAVYKPIKKAE